VARSHTVLSEHASAGVNLASDAQVRSIPAQHVNKARLCWVPLDKNHSVEEQPKASQPPAPAPPLQRRQQPREAPHSPAAGPWRAAGCSAQEPPPPCASRQPGDGAHSETRAENAAPDRKEEMGERHSTTLARHEPESQHHTRESCSQSARGMKERNPGSLHQEEGVIPAGRRPSGPASLFSAQAALWWLLSVQVQPTQDHSVTLCLGYTAQAPPGRG